MSKEQMLAKDELLEAKEFLKQHDFEEFRGVGETPLTVNVDNTRFLKLELAENTSLNLDKVVVTDADGNDVRTNASIMVSSSYEGQARFDGQRLIKGRPTGGVNFHSATEQSPWVAIDLGKRYSNLTVSVFNRRDRFFRRALSLKILSSLDLENWRVEHDNWSYKKSDDYAVLSDTKKAIVDCCAFQVNPIRKLIDDLSDEGNTEQALNLLNLANEFLRDYSLALGPHGLTQTFEVRSEQQKKLAYERLSTFLNLMNQELNIAAFVSSGTLLGFVRNGEFLGHDDDLDVCYISNESDPDKILVERDKIKETLTHLGYVVKDSDVAHLWIRTDDNFMFDLFTGWIEGDTCIMNPLPKRGVPARDVLPLKSIQSHGYDIVLPAEPESLMVLNYGENWRTPDPLWKFDWSHARQDYGFLYFGK